MLDLYCTATIEGDFIAIRRKTCNNAKTTVSVLYRDQRIRLVVHFRRSSHLEDPKIPLVLGHLALHRRTSVIGEIFNKILIEDITKNYFVVPKQLLPSMMSAWYCDQLAQTPMRQ
jgi:hypothetical protein